MCNESWHTHHGTHMTHGTHVISQSGISKCTQVMSHVAHAGVYIYIYIYMYVYICVCVYTWHIDHESRNIFNE